MYETHKKQLAESIAHARARLQHSAQLLNLSVAVLRVAEQRVSRGQPVLFYRIPVTLNSRPSHRAVYRPVATRR